MMIQRLAVSAGKSGRRNRNLVFAALMVLFGLLLLWRAKYGYGAEDEPFYLTVAHRLTKGDALFLDEWHLSQLSGVFVYPFMKLYFALGGTTEGIVLDFRYLFLAVKVVFAVVIYLFLSRKYDYMAVAAAVLYFIFTPFNLMQICYNSMGYSFLLLSGVLLITADCAVKRKKLQLFFSGVTFACAVLNCPYLVFLYLILMVSYLCVWIFAKNRGCRDVCLCLTLGCAVAALVFLVFLFSRTGLSDIIENLPEMMKDPEHGGADQTSKLIFSLFAYYKRSIAAFLAVCGLVTADGIVSRWKKLPNRLTLEVLSILLMLVGILWNYGFLLRNISQHYNLIMVPGIFLGALLIYMDLWKYGIRKLPAGALILWAFGVSYGQLLNLSSNNSLNAFSFACAISIFGTLLLAFDYIKAAEHNRKWLIGVIVSFILAQASIQVYTVTHHAYWEDNMAGLDSQITEGPLKGVWTSKVHKEDYELKLSDLKWFVGREPGAFAYYSKCAWSYLFLDMPYGTNSAWSGTFETQMWRATDYYIMHPGQLPHYIYVEQWYARDIDVDAAAKKHGYDYVRLINGYALQKRET